MVAGPSDTAPEQVISVAVSGLQGYAVYAGTSSTKNGLTSAHFDGTSLRLVFKPGSSLSDGTYADTVQIGVCTDSGCGRVYSDSIVTINVSYVVTRANAVNIDKSQFDKTVLKDSPIVARDSLLVNVSGPTLSNAIHYKVDIPSSSVVQSMIRSDITNFSAARLSFTFKSSKDYPPGTYTEQLSLQACYDFGCTKQVPGSPFVLDFSYTVSNATYTPPTPTPLVLSSRAPLGHDVVTAEFSQSMDAVVMVSAWPSNALVVRDAVTGNTRQVALSHAPLGLSLSPDGTRAAVGHDGFVSIVDLASAGTPAPSIQVIDVGPRYVQDLVLDGKGFVHVMPSSAYETHAMSVEIATGTQRSAWINSYPGHSGSSRLLPGTNFIYHLDTFTSGGGLASVDVSGPAPVLKSGPVNSFGSVYIGQKLWFESSGSMFLTDAWSTFSISTDKTKDLQYLGALPNERSGGGVWNVFGMDQKAGTREIVVAAWNYCFLPGSHELSYCSALLTYDLDTYQLTSVRELASLLISGVAYSEKIPHVFHRNDGAKVVITDVDKLSDKAQRYFIGVVP